MFRQFFPTVVSRRPGLTLASVSSSMALTAHWRSSASSIAEEQEKPFWVRCLASRELWLCLAPNSAVQIRSQENSTTLPYGGLYSTNVGKLVIFTSEPSQPWYKSALKVGAGMAIGAVVVAATPAVVGAGIGVATAGPVAGGLVATKMASAGGIAAGGALATAQSVAMGGAGTTAIASGGAVGGILSRMGWGAKKNSHCLSLRRSDVYFCGNSGKVYLAIDVLEDDILEVLSNGGKAPSSKL